MLKKVVLHSVATAFAKSVLPVPSKINNVSSDQQPGKRKCGSTWGARWGRWECQVFQIPDKV
eukprot:4476692-Pleurochrysis_carterae.AAC.1